MHGATKQGGQCWLLGQSECTLQFRPAAARPIVIRKQNANNATLKVGAIVPPKSCAEISTEMITNCSMFYLPKRIITLENSRYEFLPPNVEKYL